MLSLALVLPLLLQVPPTGGGAPALPNVPYPMEVSVTAGDVDGRALLDRVVKQLGGDKLASWKAIAFDSEYWNWRGPSLAFYEKFHTEAALGDKAIGFVNEATISPDHGGSQGVRFVVNDDDRFFVQRLKVSSSAQAELSATHMYYNQLFLALGPWLLLQADESEVIYDGVATIKRFDPTDYATADDDGNGGYSDYQPVTLEVHKLRVFPPDDFRGANGGEVELLISQDEVPKLLGVTTTVASRPFAYGPYRPTYLIEDWQDVGGVKFPKVMSVVIAGDSERKERIELTAIDPSADVQPEELKRP